MFHLQDLHLSIYEYLDNRLNNKYQKPNNHFFKRGCSCKGINCLFISLREKFFFRIYPNVKTK